MKFPISNFQFPILFLIIFLGSLFFPLISLAGEYIANGTTVCYEGLVPCGKEVFVGGQWKDGKCVGGIPQVIPCQFCHLFVMFDGIVDFVLVYIVFPVATLLLVIGGGLLLLSAGDPAKITQGRKIMTSVVIGLAIIFASWLFINTFFMAIGVQRWTGLWSETGTATGGGGHFLTGEVNKTWKPNELKGLPITITGGTGKNQRRIITGNDERHVYIDIHIERPWNPHPDITSEYRIGGDWFQIHCPIGDIARVPELPVEPEPPVEEPPVEPEGRYVIWVSQEKTEGDMGGRSGADEHCRACPLRPADCRKTQALISIEGNTIKDIITQTGWRWHTIHRGTPWKKIADDRSDLLDGSLDASIGYSEVPTFVWTGSSPDGSAWLNCTNFTSNHGGRRGILGHTKRADNQWLEARVPGVCSAPRPIYCFCEYPLTPEPPTPEPPVEPGTRYVTWVSQATTDGDMTSILIGGEEREFPTAREGANAFCQACPNKPKRCVNTKALISIENDTIRDIITQERWRWYTIHRPDSAGRWLRIADSKSDLLDGSLDAAIGCLITRRFPDYVRTGSRKDGLVYWWNCMNFTSNRRHEENVPSREFLANLGRTKCPSSGWLDSPRVATCAESFPIYCFCEYP